MDLTSPKSVLEELQDSVVERRDADLSPLEANAVLRLIRAADAVVRHNIGLLADRELENDPKTKAVQAYLDAKTAIEIPDWDED